MLLLPIGSTFAATSPATTRNAIDVAVDPRVELFSLIFKLAGNPEYSRPRVEKYDDDIEAYFGAQRNHPAVKLAKRLRGTRGISFDAPMSLTSHVSAPPELKLLVPLDPWPAEIDGRWDARSVTDFLAAARQFAVDTQFMKFFDEHRPLYEQSVKRMRAMLEHKSVVPWFEKFFGTHAEIRFHVYLGMMNGGSCYGTKLITPGGARGGGEDDYCILGVWKTDEQGDPIFTDSEVLPTVVHEFAHSFMNPLVDRHEKELATAGPILFEPVAEQMQRMAYGQWQTMMRESMVRVTVVRYLAANGGPLAGMKEVAEQASRGFTWTPQLSKLLAEYEQHRDKYPTFDAFMPRVIDFFNDTAARQAKAGAAR